MWIMTAWFYVWNSFNRYMVECEFSVRVFLFVPASGFNRYMVECECVRIYAFPDAVWF